jgi:pathogenesis-related protein 1
MPSTPARRAALLLAAQLALAACGGGTIGGDPGAEDPPVTPDDPTAAAVLAAHNAARAAATPAPSPALSPLSWSASAAAAAQAWADGCSWQHDPALGSLGMGQNIYAAGSSSPSVSASPAQVVGAWVSEAADYDYAAGSCAAGKVCGHYTAVVWRSTTAVGCGHRVCHASSPFGSQFPHWDYWVCNYVPPGNYGGQRPY